MLERVVDDVFGDDFRVDYTADPKTSHIHRADITVPNGRTIRIRATYEWNDLTIREPPVGAISFEYEDDEDAKSADLRELAVVGRAYLRGEALIETRRGLLRSRPVVTIVASGQEWVLTRHTHTVADI